ncbi:hypothetical protein BCR44DRAFT_1426528, partial [Catenaria anguillulae PL171]
MLAPEAEEIPTVSFGKLVDVECGDSHGHWQRRRCGCRCLRVSNGRGGERAGDDEIKLTTGVGRRPHTAWREVGCPAVRAKEPLPGWAGGLLIRRAARMVPLCRELPEHLLNNGRRSRKPCDGRRR